MQTTAKITLAIGDVVVVSRRRQRVGIPRREIRSISQGVQLILFPFIGVSNSLEPFKNMRVYRIFFSIEMLYCDGLDGWTGWTVTKSAL